MFPVATHRRLCTLLATLLTLPLLGGTILAQEPPSAAAAKELAALLEAKKMDAVATRIVAGEDRFAAALFFPGQLLVVSARYSAPAVLNEKLIRKDYRDIYIDLNSAFMPDTKVLVTDLGANGLQAKSRKNEPYDTMDAGQGGMNFDGNWKEDKMSEDEYMKKYSETEVIYTAALNALIAELKKN